MRLADFQKRFIIEVYDNPYVTDTAILSIARKNAKTGTIAFLLIAHLIGPVAVLNSRIISGAMSRDQASEVYNLASKTILISPKLTPLIKIIPSSKKLIGLAMNVEYQAISAEGKTAHGKSPIVAILDEVGQIRGPQSDFVDAITTAQGAYQEPLLIYISTQAANDGDLFSVIIDDAQQNKPEKTVCHVYAADEEADVLDEKAWRDANPALGLFRSESDMRKQAEKAARMPSFENTFRNLNLNQRVAAVSPFISKNVWKECGAHPGEMKGYQLYGGLDLSSKTDLTSAVFIALTEGKVKVWPYFWMPSDNIIERSKDDRQPYDVWRRQGFLRTTPGKTVKYEHVIRDIYEIIQDNEVETIAFDRWRIDVFKSDCEREGVDFSLVEFGQGFKDMAPAVDRLEEYLLNGEMQHGMHPVLTMCAANAAVVRDPAGNRKLDKSKTKSRIDGLVALTMAVGAMEKGDTEPELNDPYEDENFSIL